MKASNTRWSLLFLVGLTFFSANLQAALQNADVPAALQVEQQKNERRLLRKQLRQAHRLENSSRPPDGESTEKEMLKAHLPFIFLGLSIISYPIFYVYGLAVFSLAGLLIGLFTRSTIKDKKLRRRAFWATLCCGLCFALSAATLAYVTIIFNVW